MVYQKLYKKIYKGFQLASKNLSDNEKLLNSINVLPVADKDTGANMALSMREVASSLPKCESVKDLFLAAAGTLFHSAKGNSGTILTLFFNGFANALDGEDAKNLAAAIMAGAEKAYNGITNPMDGTILTVAIKAGEAALEAASSDIDIAELISKVSAAAHNALTLTTQQNPVLSEQNVVDSGALGFCMIIDGFEAALRGRSAVSHDYSKLKEEVNIESSEPLEYFYCTEFVIEKAPNIDIDLLKRQLNDMGDCVIPIEDEKNVKVHVHTDRPEAVFFIASLCGRLLSTKVDNMLLQSRIHAKDNQIIFLCRTQLTYDCIKSMGHKEVFLYESGDSAEFKEYMSEIDASQSFKLFTSVKVSDEIAEKIASITYFSDDDVFMNYLFAETEL